MIIVHFLLYIYFIFILCFAFQTFKPILMNIIITMRWYSGIKTTIKQINKNRI